MIIILFFYIIYLIYLTISSIFLLFYFWSSITMFFYSIFKNIFVYLNTKFNFINVKNVEIFNNKNCDSTENSTNSFTDNSTINSTINSDLNYDLDYNSKSNKNKLFHNTNYNTFEEIEIHQLSIYSNDYKEYTNYIYNNSDEMSRSIIWNC